MSEPSPAMRELDAADQALMQAELGDEPCLPVQDAYELYLEAAQQASEAL
jgi:hypothetical protein